jgi:hypothetical protein
MNTAYSTALGATPEPGASNPERCTVFDQSNNRSLDNVCQFIVPIMHPPHSVSHMADYTAGPNPMRPVTIAQPPLPLYMSCDSCNAMHFMVPLEDNRRVGTLATYSGGRLAVPTEFTADNSRPDTEHRTLELETLRVTSPPHHAFRVTYRSTGAGPGSKLMVFTATSILQSVHCLGECLAP